MIRAMDWPIYLGTIALEKNRWTSRMPSIKVSEWTQEAEAAGFSGLELWEPHFHEADEAEREQLTQLSLPISVFNSYCTFEDETVAVRERAVNSVAALGAHGIKFNVGKDPSRSKEYAANIQAFSEALPDATRLLCECHPGTIVETPAAARDFFASIALGRYTIILHPLLIGPAGINDWYDRLGDRIGHCHLQMRNERNEFIALRDRPDYVEACIESLGSQGFSGSLTIEFVRGTRSEGENARELFDEVIEDLSFLQGL